MSEVLHCRCLTSQSHITDIPVPSEPGYRNQPVTPSGGKITPIHWLPGQVEYLLA